MPTSDRRSFFTSGHADLLQDRVGRGVGIEYILCAFAASLPQADVDRRHCERGGFDDSAAGVAKHQMHLPKQAPVGQSIEVDEYLAAVLSRHERLGAANQLSASGVNIRVAEENLSRKLGERGKQGVGFLSCLLQDRHRMVSHQNCRQPQTDLQMVL